MNFLSAALRHVRDAELLATHSTQASLDQAYHLAGFGPECARKATLSRSTYDRAIGHQVKSGELALAFALAMDPTARRYALEQWPNVYPALADWSEAARYERTATRSAPQVIQVIREAREIVDRIVFALWADGKLPRNFTW